VASATRIATEIAPHPARTWRMEHGWWSSERRRRTGGCQRFPAHVRPRLGHTGGDDTIDWLTRAGQTSSIVLDNCEHVPARLPKSRRDRQVVPGRRRAGNQSRAFGRVG
jgi:hypothetical protein